MMERGGRIRTHYGWTRASNHAAAATRSIRRHRCNSRPQNCAGAHLSSRASQNSADGSLPSSGKQLDNLWVPKNTSWKRVSRHSARSGGRGHEQTAGSPKEQHHTLEPVAPESLSNHGLWRRGKKQKGATKSAAIFPQTNWSNTYPSLSPCLKRSSLRPATKALRSSTLLRRLNRQL